MIRFHLAIMFRARCYIAFLDLLTRVDLKDGRTEGEDLIDWLWEQHQEEIQKHVVGITRDELALARLPKVSKTGVL
jgi:hypothetical protein